MTRSIICCWASGPDREFEGKVPLVFAGHRHNTLGFSNEIDLLFLSGLGRLSDAYKGQLRDLGYTLHDAASLYDQVEASYPALRRFSDYERKCFLRWPVMFSLFAGEPIVHYDGDLVFNEDPAVIARLTKGTTFVLQGCPALTSLQDPEWSRQYLQALREFTDDIDGYSAKAWAERSGWEETLETRWAGSRYREIISSDQDFISHLIHTNRIVQADPADVRKALGPYLLFENPLYLHMYEPQLRDAKYARTGGIDFIGGQRVLLWHMQSDFSRYLSRFIFRKRFLGLGRRRMINDLEQTDKTNALYQAWLRRVGNRIEQRRYVYEYFFERHDLGDVLRGRSWWKEGVFA